jgi:hypothetical protein
MRRAILDRASVPCVLANAFLARYVEANQLAQPQIGQQSFDTDRRRYRN